MNPQYHNILVVRTDRIGDVILTMPSLKALREKYPDASISLLISPLTEDLVDGISEINDIIIDDRLGEHKGLGYFKLIGELRKRKFDLAIIFHTKKRTNLACYLAGIPSRIGYRNNKFGFLLTDPIADRRHEGKKHEAEYCLDVIKSIDAEPNAFKIDLPIQEESIQWVERFCLEQGISNDQKIFAIHPGASDPSKCWSEAHFSQLADKLIEKYRCEMVIVGNADARQAAQMIIANSKHDICDLTGQTSVGQLAALISRCGLLVSNDSGPVHIASGVGTPVVSIFTRNQPGINPERWRPLGELTRVVTIAKGIDQDFSFKKSQKMDSEFTELIAVSEVLQAVDSLFKLC